MNVRPLVPSLIALFALTPACLKDGGETGGETHWQKSYLAGCVSDVQCDGAFVCVNHLCSKPCQEDLQCDVVPDDYCDPGGHCVVAERPACTSATPCAADLEGWLCDETAVDACRSEVTVCRDGAWTDGVLDVCNEVMVETQPASPSGPETVVVVRSGAVTPVDALFVVDNSSSMANEQVALAREVPALVERMALRGVGDFRIAVTTPDVQCEPGGEGDVVSQGRFATSPAQTMPFGASASLRVACSEDADCKSSGCGVLGCEPDTTTWRCSRPEADTCLENPNGSLNTTCTLACASDADCTSLLGQGYTCLMPGGASGCVPALDVCPAVIPAVLGGADLELARCAVRTGVNQQSCMRYEQPLEAMRLALDADGPNPTQLAALARPNAVLAVIVVTDEEDCSVAPGEDFDELDAARCGTATTVDEGGPLQTTDHYVDFVRGLKPPGRSFFATIAGDSLASDPAEAALEREAYLASKSDALDCHAGTTICATADGRDVADYGGRLFATATAMAPDSHADNLCGGDWAAMFTRLGDALAKTATRICLPRAPSPGFNVVRVVGGVETTLTQAASGPGTWQVVAGPECSSGQAIALADPPSPEEVLRFVYAP